MVEIDDIEGMEKLLEEESYMDVLARLIPIYDTKKIEDAKMYYILGSAFCEIGDLESAIKFLKLATILDDSEFKYFAKLAQAFEKNDEPIPAMKAYIDAKELVTNDSEINKRFDKLIDKYNKMYTEN